MDARISTMGLGAAMAALAMACTGSGGANGRLAVSARTVTPAGAAATATTAGLDLGNGIVLARVRMAVQRISLEAADASAAAAAPVAKEDGSGGDGGSGGSGSGMDDGSGSESGEVEVGPFAVDLGADALAGGIHPVFDSDVPAGTYRELRIAIGPVAQTTMGTPLADLGGRSVVVDGTIDGAPFSFASSLASAQKVEMTIQVASDGSSRGVTLTVDPHDWFRGAGGARLDPTADADRAAIEAAIRASIGAELEDEAEAPGGGADDGSGHA